MASPDAPAVDDCTNIDESHIVSDEVQEDSAEVHAVVHEVSAEVQEDRGYNLRNRATCHLRIAMAFHVLLLL
jgi:hypothetical protein